MANPKWVYFRKPEPVPFFLYAWVQTCTALRLSEVTFKAGCSDASAHAILLFQWRAKAPMGHSRFIAFQSYLDLARLFILNDYILYTLRLIKSNPLSSGRTKSSPSRFLLPCTMNHCGPSFVDVLSLGLMVPSSFQ